MIPGYSWDSLPDYFRNSPFITIDNSIISPCKQVQLKESEKVNESTINCRGDGYFNEDDGDASNEVVDTQPSWTNDDKGDSQCLDRIPDSCIETNSSVSAEQDQLGSVTVMSQKLRSNLKLLNDYSYTCKNYSSLMSVNNKVMKILEDALSTLPTEGNLILRCSPSKNRQKRTLATKHSITKKYGKLRSLPMKQCKKRLTLFEKYKNRVGSFADKVKAASQITVAEHKKDPPIHIPSMNKVVNESKTVVKGMHIHIVNDSR